ncbi:hypothetical protein KC644_01955, partial [Candidatus Berkelbacteria bacterium]|nr:hypothetical protein [Candidatus Berkelbacteria bacterium]
MLGRKSTNRTLGIGSKPTADCLLPKSSERGFSLVEALLATSVFALGITGLAGSLIVGQQASVNAGSRARATDLAIEGIESVRNIRDEAFNELRFNQSGVDDSSNEWVFSGEGTTETIDNFTRTISFADVCRDSNNEIVACPGDFTDPHTKQITSTVDWAPRPGATASVSRTTYLTNWETYTWTQTDWSGGAGQAIWSDPAQYDTDNGNIDTSSSGQISLAQNGSNVFFVDDEETEFNQGSHSDTTYNIGNSALELDSTGIAAGAGTFTSRIFDSGNASTAWDDISWVEDLGPRGELRMEAGVTTATNSFSVVTLTQNYDSPVVIPIYYESANTEPVSVRLRNVTGSSFEVRLQRPDGGTAVADTVHYLVIEEGAHILPDGRQLEAHLHTTSTVGSKSGGWSSDAISYSHSYSAAPAVFHQVQTNNDSSWIESWVRSPLSRTNPPTSTGFNLALNGAEAITSHGSETIGWLAIETGAGTLNGVDYEVTYTSDSVLGHANGCYSQSFTNSYASNPIVVADQEEMDGGDGSWAVMCGLSTAAVSVHAEEDTVGDTDRSHTTETFAFMAWEEAFSFKALDLTLQVRSCDDAACSGEVFVGPDGTSGTVFTTPGGEALNLPDNRYVQYQVVLTTTDGVFTPQLTQVTIAGTAPEVTWWDTNYG